MNESINRRRRAAILLLWLVVLPMVFLAIPACSDSHSGGKDEYLVRVEKLVLTRGAFDQAFDLAVAAYPSDAADAPERMEQLRVQLLEQMIEELVMEIKARDLGIEISDQELDSAIDAIKKDYPDNTFEETLLENAIPFKVWRERMRKRLLKDKIVKTRLADRVDVTPADIAQFYNRAGGADKDRPGEPSNRDDTALVRQIRIQKTETAYRDWIEAAKREYPIEINETLWKEYNKGS